MPASNYPNGFAEGVTIRGVPLIQTHPGKVFWVSNSTTGLLPGQRGGSDGNKGTFDAPFATIDYAIGQCTANRGDIIFVKANHAETITAASGITADVAGVAIVGLGSGTDRPELTFGTATGASIVVSAANVSFVNLSCIGNIDGLTQPFDVQATDCYIDVEWRDTSATVEAVRAILTTAAADRLTVKLKYRGQTGGDACVNAVRLVGADGADIEIDFYGKASTSVVEFVTTACTNVNVRGYIYNSGTTDGSKNVVDTVTGSTWYSDIVDGAAGSRYTGGSAASVASDDITAVTNALYGAAGIATYPAAAAAANAVSIAEVIRYIEDALVGTAGVVTYPAAAAAANAVSIAEVLRFTQDRAAVESLNRNSTNYLSVTADFTSATWNTIAKHEVFTVTGTVRMRVLAEATGNGAGATATIQMGTEDATSAWIGVTTITDFVTGELWYDTTPTTFSETLTTAVLDKIVSGGKDVGYEIVTAAATGGGILFHCWWEPISSDGAVVAGAGGTL